MMCSVERAMRLVLRSKSAGSEGWVRLVGGGSNTKGCRLRPEWKNNFDAQCSLTSSHRGNVIQNSYVSICNRRN
jgi:hypothetical protein